MKLLRSVTLTIAILATGASWCVGVPATPTPLSPSSTVTIAQPQFSWTAISDATWFQIWIQKDGAYHYGHWTEGTNTWTPSWDTQDYPGAYEWWVRAWNEDGYSAWSSALTFTIGSELPAAPELLTPSGTVTQSAPTFAWNAVTNAEWYQVWIHKDAAYHYSEWVQTSTSWTPTWDMQDYPGDYEWWVQAWGESGLGPWSTSVTFCVAGDVPAAPELLSPSNTVTQAAPTFTWSALTDADWYHIWLQKDGSYHYSEWIQTTASWTPTWDMRDYPGAYEWWVQAWNENGYGTWSSSLTFTIANDTGVGTPALLTPTGDTSTNRPLFAWSAVTGATWYQLYVNRNGAYHYSEWIEGAASWTPTWDMDDYPGDYEWWVRAWVGSMGAWSTSATFSIVSEVYTLEQTAFLLVNQHRVAQGLAELTWNETIAVVCREHSQNMADGTVPVGHTGSATRFATIAQTIEWEAMAENVAMNQGYPAPAAQAVTGWVASPGHLANIEGDFNISGLGVAVSTDDAYYFTQIFVRTPN